MECPFCCSSFGSKSALILHQKSAKYCLDMQNNQGVASEPIIHICKYCGKKFTLKTSLMRHRDTCKIGIGKEQYAQIEKELTSVKEQLAAALDREKQLLALVANTKQ